MYMQIAGRPVVFCFVAWMREYEGVTREDVPIWDGRLAVDGLSRLRGRPRAKGFFLGESSNFLRVHDRLGRVRVFGHVQAVISTPNLGGTHEIAEGVVVVWCAADPRDRDRVKVVGWYQDATIYRWGRELSTNVRSTDLRKFGQQTGFNVVADCNRSILLPEGRRPKLPVVPGNSAVGRWHAQSKTWKGGGSAKLLSFVKRLLAKDPGSLQRAPVSKTQERITRREVVQTVRDRQGQFELRKMLLRAYDLRCAVSGCRTEELLDACHVYPASHADSYHGGDNALLLRTDLHTLFDLGLMAIHPRTKIIWISSRVKERAYTRLNGKPLRSPRPGYQAPSERNLRHHWGLRKQH